MPYFTTAELRALPDLTGAAGIARFPDARLVEAHDWIVGIIERECNTSFIVTTVTGERVSGGGSDYLQLRHDYVRTVSAVTVDGTVYDAPTLANLYIENSMVYQPTGASWSSATRGNVTVTYTYGYSATVPADLKQAALRGARHWLLTMDVWSGADSRSTAITNEWGNITLSVAGEDRPTGIPDVDATIMAWARKVRIPAVA